VDDRSVLTSPLDRCASEWRKLPFEGGGILRGNDASREPVTLRAGEHLNVQTVGGKGGAAPGTESPRRSVRCRRVDLKSWEGREPGRSTQGAAGLPLQFVLFVSVWMNQSSIALAARLASSPSKPCPAPGRMIISVRTFCSWNA